MALIGNIKDESDLGDVAGALDYIEQQRKDKERLLRFIREFGKPNCRKGVYQEIECIVNKYM